MLINSIDEIHTVKQIEDVCRLSGMFNRVKTPASKFELRDANICCIIKPV